MSERFTGNDLDAWLEHFSLTALKSKIIELGAETVQDLLFIYEDAELLMQMKEASPKPLIFKRFENARQLTDTFGVTVIPEAKPVSPDSSAATTGSSTAEAPTTVISATPTTSKPIVSTREWSCTYCGQAGNDPADAKCIGCAQTKYVQPVLETSSWSWLSPLSSSSCRTVTPHAAQPRYAHSPNPYYRNQYNHKKGF